MGDAADMLREAEELARDLHAAGECDSFCSLCWDEDLMIEELDIMSRGVECFVPVTPGDTVLCELAAMTEQGAIDNLLEEAQHMPYDGWDSPDGFGFKQRGYTIGKVKPVVEKRDDAFQS